ncbi:hypothetical protein ACPTG8_14095, partial [Enterococcus faecium]|uniref:hypothetical protein n=1 Tax=Enterococcus faecium TaxID=1352 RepID=UPI003CC6A6A4
VFYCKPVCDWVAISKDAIDPQPDTTVGHVITQDEKMASMDTLGIFVLPDLTAKACNESIGRYWIFDHC